MNSNTKSNMRVYLLLWIVILICYIFVYYSILSSIIVFLAYVAITWLASMIINSYEVHRLINYVKDNYKEEYIKMKSINGKEGVHNGFATLAFLFSNNYQDDENLVKLKMNYKKIILLISALVGSYIVLYIVIMFSGNI